MPISFIIGEVSIDHMVNTGFSIFSCYKGNLGHHS